MKLKDKRIAIFVDDLFEDIEFWYPFYRLKEEGATVTVISAERGIFTGKKGTGLTSKMAIYDAEIDSFDALVIPGGYAPDRMRRSPDMVDFVKEMNDRGKIIAAICHAGWMLASAGILQDKKVTSFFSIKDDMVNAGGQWVDEEVVKDGNFITSRKPDDLPAFCRAIIASLS